MGVSVEQREKLLVLGVNEEGDFLFIHDLHAII